MDGPFALTGPPMRSLLINVVYSAMKMRIPLFLAGILLLCCCAIAIQNSSQQTSPPPKQKKAAKPKKHGPEVILLKILDKTGATGDESTYRGMFARAGALHVFKVKKIEDISPAEIQGTMDQLEIDFAKPENWTPENFDKLAEPWDATYVAAATVDSLEPAKVTAGTKNPMIMAGADVTIWLYDVKQHKFIVEHQSSHYDYMNKKGDMPADPKAAAYEAISGATDAAFMASFKTKPK